MTAPAGTSTDPFSIFEDTLWFALESYAPLAALVKIGNRIKLTGTKDDPYEGSSSSGDFPELQVWPAGANVSPGAVPRSSSTYFWHQRYSIGITTDKIRTNLPASINPLKWNVLRAIARAEYSLIKPAVPFVSWIKPGDFRDQVQDVNPTGQERGVRGWKAVLDLEVEFQFSLTEIRA